MKIRKKRKNGEESYWKSFTDIMAGLLLIILLVLMLLLLYMTQMNKEAHRFDHEYDAPYTDNNENNNESNHKADEMYDRPPQEGGGGGDGGYGDNTGDGEDHDYGHDKAAVFVTVVDEETKKVIKKDGIVFELYNNKDARGSLQTLNTYYPVKVSYKQFETTKEGTFFLPEKIIFGWYSLHNIKAPKGYSFAEDVNFEVRESRDWSNPYNITVPMSPSKGKIYIHSIDAGTKKNVGGGTYEVFAAENVTTLDGTVRYKAGDKVDEFTCDANGKGVSKKLYYGKYSIKQKAAPQYYAVNNTPLNVELAYTEKEEEDIHKIESEKTLYELTLVDQDTKEPISGVEFAIKGRENLTTDEKGRVYITNLDKSTTYKLNLVKLPEPYRTKSKEYSVSVDAAGLINGKAVESKTDTAYIIRLSVSVKDILFGNNVSAGTIRLYDASGEVVEEWTASGSEEEFTNLEPGIYTLEADNNQSTRQSINLRDSAGRQTLEISIWTLWDTLAVIGAAVVAVLLIVLVISLIRSRRKRKHYEEEKGSAP